jgi:hypothetical protein
VKIRFLALLAGPRVILITIFTTVWKQLSLSLIHRGCLIYSFSVLAETVDIEKMSSRQDLTEGSKVPTFKVKEKGPA